MAELERKRARRPVEPSLAFPCKRAASVLASLGYVRNRQCRAAVKEQGITTFEISSHKDRIDGWP